MDTHYRLASYWQWDDIVHGNSKQPYLYFVICKNLELAYMQGVPIGNAHIECFVDDFGNLVKAS